MTAATDVIGELIEHLPIFAFDGGRMDQVDVNTVMDWGTAGAGAAMLAKRWGSPRLIDLSEVPEPSAVGEALDPQPPFARCPACSGAVAARRQNSAASGWCSPLSARDNAGVATLCGGSVRLGPSCESISAQRRAREGRGPQ